MGERAAAQGWEEQGLKRWQAVGGRLGCKRQLDQLLSCSIIESPIRPSDRTPASSVCSARCPRRCNSTRQYDAASARTSDLSRGLHSRCMKEGTCQIVRARCARSALWHQPMPVLAPQVAAASPDLREESHAADRHSTGGAEYWRRKGTQMSGRVRVPRNHSTAHGRAPAERSDARNPRCLSARLVCYGRAH